MKINDREYKLSLTGETLIIYKENFHKDFLTVVSDTNNLITDYETLFSVIWALAKPNNENMPEYIDFMKSLSAEAIRDIIKIETIINVSRVINGDMETTVKYDNEESSKEETKKNL